ncbi:MAG: MBOAT family protein [Lachnospiraceae bacterium]|nr:MBOAT family protein [Lachnospiraceae bacterium]
MTYVSYVFVLFVGLTVFLYYILPKCWQWKILLGASIIFYLSSGPFFVLYLLIFSAISWYGAKKIEKYEANGGQKSKLAIFIVSCLVIANIGFLFSLKWGSMGLALLNKIFHLQLAWQFILPLGISFFTFQNISYLFDVYRGKQEAEKNFWHYLLYSCYFPYIVSGPINRYEEMKNQFFIVHTYRTDTIYSSVLRILWGYIKKMVIADRAAIFVNQVFDYYYMYRGIYIVVAVLLFTLQLYMDFSGCMDIVIGVSNLFGIAMKENFQAPFGAVTTAEFWRKWHVSLTSWFRDYLYIPLGGNQKGKARKNLNIMIVFIFCGMWHGAGITYIVWGFLNGLYQIVGELTSGFRRTVCDIIGLKENSWGTIWRKRLVTFTLGEFAWLFFRANGIQEAFIMIKRCFTGWNPWILSDGSIYQVGLGALDFIILIIGAISVGWVSRVSKEKNLHHIFLQQSWLCQTIIILFALVIWYLFGIYGPGFNSNNFIYYNF